MSAAERHDSQLRDSLLSGLLAESLASPASTGAPCPDAETVALYAERSLGPEEAARLDVHFADCARCQTVLAALVRSLEASPSNATAESPADLTMLASIPQVNVEPPAKLRAPVSSDAPPPGTPSLVSPSKIRTMPLPQPTRWRQLAPAVGIAAAVALWFALRPAPPTQNLSAQLRTDTETYATQAPAPPLPPANNSETAGNNIPAPPPPAAQRESQRPSADASRTEALKKETPRSPAAPPEALQEDALQERDLRKSESAEQPPNQQASAASAGVAAPAEPLQSAQATINSARSSAAPAPAFAPSAPTPPPAADEAKTVAPIAPAGRRPQILALTNVALPTFASPSRAVVWRLGRGGSIERSTDQGQTWERQASGVSTDLVAGSASSNDAAWVVGRTGVILRTTDGVHWQRVSLPPASGDAVSPMAKTSTKTPSAPAASGAASSPAPSSAPANGTALDLAGVEARDALHATVIAADGRRFATADGGNTWTPQ